MANDRLASSRVAIIVSGISWVMNCQRGVHSLEEVLGARTFPRMGFRALPGTEVAGYRIVAEVGRGDSATVYLADHPRLGRQVALKILTPELAEEPMFRTRFTHEAAIAAALEHPNVLPVYDAGDSEGLLWLAMRFIDGSDLSAMLRREGPLALERALPMFAQVAAALDAAHARGLLHRHVKPTNILIDIGGGPRGSDHLYLADFGLAQSLLGISGLTHAGEFHATVEYMAPEQLAAGVVDARTDVYALACLCYEALVGSPPFHRDTPGETAAAHLNEAPPVPSEHRAELGSEVDIAIRDALSKDKTVRPVSAGALMALLEGGSHRIGGHVAPHPPDVALAAERKVITALFCDLVGSTELGERMDPEDLQELLHRYQQIVREPIENHGGVVEKFIGDAVVGIFGVPASHEDDPERAVRAGLRIVRDVEASNLAQQVRIGIATGETLVRLGADPSAGEAIATGGCLATASRLQGLAPSMGVVVDGPTHEVTEFEFEFESPRHVTLKGKAETVTAWRALQPRSRAGWSGIETTPFLGRTLELESLTRLLERSRLTPSTEFVTVVAEPGLGKSRLVRELARHVDALP